MVSEALAVTRESHSLLPRGCLPPCSIQSAIKELIDLDGIGTCLRQ